MLFFSKDFRGYKQSDNPINSQKVANHKSFTKQHKKMEKQFVEKCKKKFTY